MFDCNYYSVFKMNIYYLMFGSVLRVKAINISKRKSKLLSESVRLVTDLNYIQQIKKRPSQVKKVCVCFLFEINYSYSDSNQLS